MATKTIGSGGGRDYANIAAWITYLQGIGTLTEPEIGELYNDSEFSVAGPIANFTGFTPSASNYVELRAASGQGFKDHASAATNPLRYDQSKGVGLKCTGNFDTAIIINVSYVRLTGLQVTHTTAESRNCLVVNSSGLTGIQITRCLFDKAAGTTGSVATIPAGTVETSVFVQRQSAGGDGIAVNFPGTVSFNGCTIVRPSDITAGGNGIYADQDPVPVTNCAIFGFSNDVNDDTRFSGNNNASDVAIGFGTSNQASLAYSSQFENTTSASLDLRAKSGGGLINNGTGSATDIIGQAVSGGTKDIGAWEFQSGGGGSPEPFTRTPRGIAEGVGRGVSFRTFVDMGRLLVPARRLILPPGLVAAI